MKSEEISKAKLVLNPYVVIVSQNEGKIQFRIGEQAYLVKDKKGKLLKLLSLIDGKHTISELESLVGDEVKGVIEQLIKNNIIGDAKDITTPENRFYEQIILFSHFKDPQEIQNKLENSSIDIFSQDKMGKLIAESLKETGIKNITVKDYPYDVKKEDIEVRKTDLFLLFQDEFHPTLLEIINKIAIEKEMKLLLCFKKGREGFILSIIPHQTPCYKCFDLRMKANLDHYDEYLKYERYLKDNVPVTYGALPSFYSILSNLATIEIVKIITGFYEVTTYSNLYTIDLLTLRSDIHHVLKVPTCPVCGRGVCI